MLRREASRVVGHLAGEGDDAVLGGDIHRGGFQQRLGVKLGLDAGADGVIGRLIAAKGEQEEERKSREPQSSLIHEPPKIKTPDDLRNVAQVARRRPVPWMSGRKIQTTIPQSEI